MELSPTVSITLFLSLTVALGVLWMCDATIQVERPRGVSLSNEPLYNKDAGGDFFTCLDGSLKIPRSQINDDYCDCPDSSDEPGTSACPGGRFHCNNRGYRPQYIPSSRVNDGICDCCDGSDEYEGVGARKCVNNCKELGKKDLEERKQQMVIFNQGFDIRQGNVKEGQAKKTEREESLKKLQAERGDAEANADEKKKLKEAAETPETEAKDKHKAAWEAELASRKAAHEHERALQAFTELDIDSDGHILFHELQARTEFDTDESGHVNEEEAKTVLGGRNAVDQATFVQHLWGDVKEKFKFAHELEAEQAAAAAAKQQEGQTPDDPAAFEDFLEPEDEWADEDEEEDIDDEDDDWAEEEDDDIYSEDEDDYVDEPQEVKEARNQRRLDRMQQRAEKKKKLRESVDADVKSEEEMPDYDDATKVLITAADQARTDYDEAEQGLKNIDRSIGDIEKQLKVDLGPEQEFYVMQGQCYEYTDREYTYKLCPFDKSSQRPKNGGSETSLGHWSQWEGPADNKYSGMLYTRGQKCWNGPDRSTKVILRCGTEIQLLSASEPDRCVYQFELTTPALCTQKYDLSTGETDNHDEL